jgi:hypothetical protein
MTRVLRSAWSWVAVMAACNSPARSDAPSASAVPFVPSPAHVAISPAGAGAVADVVRDALSRASAQHRKLVVYVGATWCEPCQHFHHAAERGELDSAFPDLTLLEFDADRDRGRLADARYTSKYIPLFVLPNADGTSSGQQIEGGVKGEGAVADITPRLTELLAR